MNFASEELRHSPRLKKKIKKVDPPLDPEKSSDLSTDSEALKKALRNAKKTPPQVSTPHPKPNSEDSKSPGDTSQCKTPSENADENKLFLDDYVTQA